MEGGAAARTPLPAVLGLCVIPILLHIAIVVSGHYRSASPPEYDRLFKLGFVTASAITHWGIYASLLLTFGFTLRPGREALITTMARRMHGDSHGVIPNELAVYTSRVTMAWCCFFGAQLVTSITLFCLAPLVVWSFFVNILDIPLVAAMFSAEYLYRLRSLKNPPRHSLSVILKMISEPAGSRAGKSAIPASAAQPD